MAELLSIIVPESSAATDKCYPLQRRETYFFPDGSRLERDVPYWQPAEERFIEPDGTVYRPEGYQPPRLLDNLVCIDDV